MEGNNLVRAWVQLRSNLDVSMKRGGSRISTSQLATPRHLKLGNYKIKRGTICRVAALTKGRP